MIEDGRLDEARGRLQELVERVPTHAAAHVLLARIAGRAQDWEAALEWWRKADRLAPEHPMIRSSLAITYMRARPAVGPDAIPERTEEEAAEPAEVEVDTAQQDMDEAAVYDEGEQTDEPAPQTENPPAFEDLDSLIDQLEDARIVPDPDVGPMPEDELDDEIEDVVSETLAQIYANQKYFEEAARVYEKLALQQPERRGEFLSRAEDIRKGEDAEGNVDDADDADQAEGGSDAERDEK